ncbi:ribosomal-protein-alanine N-acetyltransferase [Methanococcus maripaludis]|uniref:Ribosomal-protein-alanine N-acetyltransferase n=1 Tax=Methanococcus maripaludis TaxID=39152 RepID=A0A7J9S2L6_METMI|nr:ribosomal-protein-alanine N-acetyltransferase [Methanococcus maripaludis]MBB6401037.1 ribosomal-protein-alanine N-acetyltransferase [Methanococcus maripaludis]
MEKMVIRNARKTDIDEIMNIEYDSFIEGISENRNVFLDRIATFQNGFLVLEVDSEILGYISSEIWEYSENIDEKMFDLNHDIKKVHKCNGSELYISSIGILKKHRKNGYGNLLFKELIEKISKNYKISSMILTVSVNWKPAIKLYEKNGFKEIGRIKEFFEDDDSSDGIVMRKYI